MKKNLLLASALFATVYTASVTAAENQSSYLSDWWHQSVNVVGSYHTRFGPQLNNDVYLEYEAFARKEWLDFYGYIDVPKFFGAGNHNNKGVWDNGSPFFMEIEPRFSIDNLTDTKLGFGPFKEWYFANNYIYDQGKNRDSRQNTWYMGLGTDIETNSKLALSLNLYTKYQWANYRAGNENSWDGYRFKVKYFLPLTELWGGNLSYVGFTNFDWGSDLREQDGPARTSNSIASSHILSLGYDHWHYSIVARYFHNGGQWADGTELNFGKGDFDVKSTGWGYYLVAGYNF